MASALLTAKEFWSLHPSFLGGLAGLCPSNFARSSLFHSPDIVDKRSGGYTSTSWHWLGRHDVSARTFRRLGAQMTFPYRGVLGARSRPSQKTKRSIWWMGFLRGPSTKFQIFFQIHIFVKRLLLPFRCAVLFLISICEASGDCNHP